MLPPPAANTMFGKAEATKTFKDHLMVLLQFYMQDSLTTSQQKDFGFGVSAFVCLLIVSVVFGAMIFLENQPKHLRTWRV